MPLLLGFFVAALTFPIWGSAVVGVLSGAFYLFFTNPFLLILLIAFCFVVFSVI